MHPALSAVFPEVSLLCLAAAEEAEREAEKVTDPTFLRLHLVSWLFFQRSANGRGLEIVIVAESVIVSRWLFIVTPLSFASK